MEYVLQTFDLTKKYKKHFAVHNVNMHICKGDIYGFVGENGSGKTTIIRLITGLIFPYAGNFSLFGVSNQTNQILKEQKKVGAIVETPSIYKNMSAYDNLKMQSAIIGLKDDNKIKEVLQEVGLAELYGEKKHAGDFSLGMRQRLGIAMALLGDPEFLILDEPMNGLDPAGIVALRELILKLNHEKNITFLISSHILTELALIATKYGIISKGKLIKEISAEELKKSCEKTTTIHVSDGLAAQNALASILPASQITYTDNQIEIKGDVRLNSIFEPLIQAGVEIETVSCSEFSIENYYLSLIGGTQHG